MQLWQMGRSFRTRFLLTRSECAQKGKNPRLLNSAFYSSPSVRRKGRAAAPVSPGQAPEDGQVTDGRKQSTRRLGDSPKASHRLGRCRRPLKRGACVCVAQSTDGPRDNVFNLLVKLSVPCLQTSSGLK